MENIYYIKNVLVLLSAAIMIVACFKALKLSPVLGYFVAGAALGKHGMSLIAPGTGMELFAELGIVFLLFVIGLELTLKRLVAMKDYILAGIVQIVVTFIIFVLFFYFSGHGPNPAAVIAGGLSLSSTAIVLQVLRENGMQATKVGRLSIAMLLIQDFVVVPMLVLVPYLANASPESSLTAVVAMALLKAAVGLAIVFLIGRLLFRPIFNIIAYFESDELFIATTILIVLGSAYATEKLGLSMALGAFVSGLVVAETTYRHEVEQVVVPFKALLLGLFFMTIGMSLDVWTLILMLPKISIMVLSIVLIKLLVIFSIARIFGCNNKEALHTGLLLSQGGEFAFILFKLSFRQGLLDAQTAQVLMISATITMAITPLLDFIGGKINSISEEDEDISNLAKDEFETDGHVVIIGANTTSMALADILIEEGVNFAILDINPDVVIKHKKDGYPIYYGNVTDAAALKKINVQNALATVVAIKNEITAKKAVNAVKQFAPKTKIVIRSRNLKDLEDYKKLGVYFLMPPQHEEALTLSSLVLKIYGYTEASIENVRKNFEIQDYASQDELY